MARICASSIVARDGRDLVRPVDRERQRRWRRSPRQGGETRQRGLGLGAAIVSDETAAAAELVMNPRTERRQLRARYAGQHDLLDLGDAGERETVCAGDEEPARRGKGVGAERDPDLVGGRGGRRFHRGREAGTASPDCENGENREQQHLQPRGSPRRRGDGTAGIQAHS